MRKQWIKIDKKIILNYQPDYLSYKGIPVDDFAEPSKIIRTLVIILATLRHGAAAKIRDCVQSRI